MAEAASGLHALKRVWKPFVLIQSFAVLAAVTYYLVPGAAGVWRPLGELKAHYGLLGSAIATVFASIVIPQLARVLTKKAREATTKDYLFEVGFFATIGVVVDLLYQLQTRLFGTGIDLVTLAQKVAFDQFVVAPLTTIPFTAILFIWRESNFDLNQTKKALPGFRSKYWSLMTTCWAFWLPVLCCVYAMPSVLQFPLYLFTQAAWSLLIVTMSDQT
ncbi:MAG: hypothetical protein ACOYON_14090 [Fimbriimonas sp.]